MNCWTVRRSTPSCGPSDVWIAKPRASCCGRQTAPRSSASRTRSAPSRAPITPRWRRRTGRCPRTSCSTTGIVRASTTLAPLARDEAHPSLDIPADAPILVSITIIGGAYHEVRRIFAALGSHVFGLCRVRFGDIELPRDLAPGGYRLLP